MDLALSYGEDIYDFVTQHKHLFKHSLPNALNIAAWFKNYTSSQAHCNVYRTVLVLSDFLARFHVLTILCKILVLVSFQWFPLFLPVTLTC